MSNEHDFGKQASLLDTLADEKRLRILEQAVEGPVSAPRLAETDDFEITSESILYHLDKLESAGFLESKTVRGKYKRANREFQLVDHGILLHLEVIRDGEYEFDFRYPSVA